MAGEITAMSASMNGGDGENSYSRNSSYQGRSLKHLKGLMQNVIDENFDVCQLISSGSKVIKIADCGCSVGPNTFYAMKSITEVIKLKYPQLSLEFQVFFNDHVSNDFNTLFKNVPHDGDYFVAGVPGSFHGPLFPKGSLDFIYSSFSLHWLSNSPKELLDKDSIAYNKGRVYYANASVEVFEAYTNQYVKDINSFLSLRAQELAQGGLMALFIPCAQDGAPRWQCDLEKGNVLLEACLLDMAKEGLISESMIDSFNIPIYYPTTKELKALVEDHDSLRVVRMEPIMVERKIEDSDSQFIVRIVRAAMEATIINHFGNDIVDGLFNRFHEKLKYSKKSGGKRYETIIMSVILQHKTV